MSTAEHEHQEHDAAAFDDSALIGAAMTFARGVLTDPTGRKLCEAIAQGDRTGAFEAVGEGLSRIAVLAAGDCPAWLEHAASGFRAARRSGR
jgi:hypothetical protein